MAGKAKILLVDDDPDILMAMSAVLESQNYEVITADDGEQALVKLRDERPDLMVLDLLMPRMDGFTVCKELKDPRRARYANLPILILSSVREEASRRRYELETGLSLDVADYIEKPIEPFVLLQRVEKLLKQKRGE